MPRDSNSDRRVLAVGRFVRLVAQDNWEWAERTNTSGAVIVIPVTERRELVLVEQYRIPLARRVIELPAGLVGDVAGAEQEAMAKAARRELLEETGFEAQDLQYLAEGPSSAGLASELYALFLAAGVRRVGPGGGEPGENIQVHVVDLDSADAWLAGKRKEGILVDPKIYAGLYFASRSALPASR